MRPKREGKSAGVAMKVSCQIRRQEPGGNPWWERYEVEIRDGSTAMDLLHAIAGRDPGLAFPPHHCKMGICSACSLLIDGRQRLACRTLVSAPEIRLEPIPGSPLIKDLLVDFLAWQEKLLTLGKESE